MWLRGSMQATSVTAQTASSVWQPATELTRIDSLPKFALSALALRPRPDTIIPSPFKGFDNHDPHWREETEQWATPLGS